MIQPCAHYEVGIGCKGPRREHKGMELLRTFAMEIAIGLQHCACGETGCRAENNYSLQGSINVCQV